MQVKCKVGDIVSKGQVVVVLEAMKMEYPITAPAAGQVSTLGCVRAPESLAQQQKSSASLQVLELRQPTPSHARFHCCSGLSTTGPLGSGQRTETSVLHHR